MSNRTRRIMRELDDLSKDTISGMSAEVLGSDLSHLRGKFEGPPQTPYEGGHYVVDIKIPNEYPFRPPVMRFETMVYHPNVSSQTGAICLDTLSAAWSPVLTIKSALLSLQSLLSTPEPKDPQDAEVAGILIRNPRQFEKTAREWAVRYAGAPDVPATGSTIVDKVDGEGEKRRKEEEEGAKYEGYPRPLVDRFGGMGFEVPRIVAALKSVGVPRSGGRMSEEIAEEVVERLLTMA